MPVEVIIQRFAANEDLAKRVFDTYNFMQTIRVEELSDDGGKFTASGEVFTRPDGGRVWRVKGQPESDLKARHYSLEEVREMIAIPMFSLTSDEIPNYNFLYAGQDKLDDLNTYVFQVKPKQLNRTRRFFEGAIWVDDHDLAIVKSYGKFVSELTPNRPEMPFSMFETYRENFQEKYWLPTYTNSDDYVEQKDSPQLHMRLVIRASDLKIRAAGDGPQGNPPATSSPQALPPSASPPDPGRR